MTTTTPKLSLVRPGENEPDSKPAHIPTASPKPTTTKAIVSKPAKAKSTKVPNAVQSRMSDAQVGERVPPEPTSETLALSGGAQTIAMGKGNLRNLQRGQILEITVHATVVEAGGVRDKLGKGGAVADSIAKVVAAIDRFDEVKVVGMTDVDGVEDDHPGDAPADPELDAVLDREPCHRCDGKGSHVVDGGDTEPCGLCEGVGSIPKSDAPASTDDVDEPTAPAGDDGFPPVPCEKCGEVTTQADATSKHAEDRMCDACADATVTTDSMFGAPASPPVPTSLVIGDESTYTEANLSAKSVTKADLHACLAGLIDRDVPAGTTKAKALKGILDIVAARQSAASMDEAAADAEAQAAQGAPPAEADPVPADTPEAPQEPATVAQDVDQAPAADAGEQAADAANVPGEPDDLTTGRVCDIADDGSDIVAGLDADGFRVFVHDRSGQVFDTLKAAVAGPAPVVEGSVDADPAPQVDGQSQVEVDGQGMTLDDASALTPVQLAAMDDAQLVDVAAALGVDRTQAASLNRVALLAVIDREQVPF
jgi:hypothetical protein